MIVSLFIQITVFIWYVALTALLLLLSYIWIKKLLLDPIQYLIETSPKNQKGNLMKPGHLDNHIFNLDAIVMTNLMTMEVLCIAQTITHIEFLKLNIKNYVNY